MRPLDEIRDDFARLQVLEDRRDALHALLFASANPHHAPKPDGDDPPEYVHEVEDTARSEQDDWARDEAGQ